MPPYTEVRVIDQIRSNNLAYLLLLIRRKEHGQEPDGCSRVWVGCDLGDRNERRGAWIEPAPEIAPELGIEGVCMRGAVEKR